MKIRPIAGSYFVMTLALILLFITGAQFHAATAQADDATWAVRTESNTQGADRTNYGYNIRPGESIDDGIVIVNRGTTPLDLGVYAADGFTTDSGGFDLQPGDGENKSLGEWVRVKQDRITVNPNESVTVPFTLTVPSNATPGDYAGGIVSSMVVENSATQGQGVSVDRRLGIRMAVRVDGPLNPSLAIDNVQMSWNGELNPFVGGEVAVDYTVRNTGNTVIGSQGAVAVSGPFGWFPVEAKSLEPMPSLLPGETWTQRIKAPNVFALVLLTATTNVTPTATDAAGSTSLLPMVTMTGTAWAVPWMLLLILALLVTTLILTLRFLRGRRARQRQNDEERVRKAVAEALAERNGSTLDHVS